MPSRAHVSCLAVLTLLPAFPQGLAPRPQPTDYQAHIRLPAAALAADYLARTVPLPHRPVPLSNYLVLEVAFFPSAQEKILLSSSHFSLRLNGKKTALLPQSPGLVAAELRYPDWEPGPQVIAGGGIGDVGVILGPRPPVERFPGDPRARRPRLPDPAPSEKSPPNQNPEAPPPDAFVQQAALPEGQVSHPVAGLLYFAFKGKTKSVRSLELVYSGPAGAASLRLF